MRLACLKAFRKSSLFAFGAESGRDRGRSRGRRQSSCLEGFKLAPRLTGIAQSREAFRKIWLSSWADTLSIFALRILDSSRTLCLCRRRDGRPRQNNLGGGRAPVELKAVPHSWVCLKSSAGQSRTRITLRSPSPGTATLKSRTGVASPPPSSLLSSLPPSWPRGLSCLCQRPRWFGSRLQPSRESINVLIHLQFFQDFSKMANFGTQLFAPRASWIGPLPEEGPSRARGGLSRLRARPSFASAPLLSSGPRLSLRALLAMARYW